MQRITTSTIIPSLSADHPPVARADSGSRIVFETLDCYANQIQHEHQGLKDLTGFFGNPATGPVFIKGAEPGDVLKIHIADLRIGEQGTMLVHPKWGALAGHLPEKTRRIPIRDGKAIFNDRLSLPLNPMIGVIGVAPKGQAVPTSTPGAHGGNMDCKRIAKGATLYLEVNVPGALLAIGDLHAAMGDGEIVVCGLEIPGEVTVDVEVLKNLKLPLPMLLDDQHVMTIASAQTLDEASRDATRQMHRFLIDELQMDPADAGMILSLVGDLRICQIVDPLLTARMELPRWVLAKYGYQMK
jgi:amidase